MKNISPFLLLSLLILFSNCDDDLPEPTKNGANTFGCLVNGDSWVATVDGFTESATDALFYLNTDGSAYLTLTGILDDDNDIRQTIRVRFRAENFAINTKYRLDDEVKFRDDNRESSCSFITIDTAMHNEVVIKHIDEENRTISGTFEYTCREDECDETVVISEGRFDVQYRQ